MDTGQAQIVLQWKKSNPKRKNKLMKPLGILPIFEA